jgi:hypothetical protein
MIRPNYNKHIDVPEGMIYVYGYDVVNGQKSEFVEEDKMYTDSEMKERRKELEQKYSPYSVNFYTKKPKSCKE